MHADSAHNFPRAPSPSPCIDRTCSSRNPSRHRVRPYSRTKAQPGPNRLLRRSPTPTPRWQVRQARRRSSARAGGSSDRMPWNHPESCRQHDDGFLHRSQSCPTGGRRRAGTGGLSRRAPRSKLKFKAKPKERRYEHERRCARPLQCFDPQAWRHRSLLRGHPGPGERATAAIRFPRRVALQRRPSGAASQRYLTHRPAAASGFRRHRPCRLRQPWLRGDEATSRAKGRPVSSQ